MMTDDYNGMSSTELERKYEFRSLASIHDRAHESRLALEATW